MAELNMSEAIRLTYRFIDSVYSWQAGQTGIDTVAQAIFVHWSFMRRTHRILSDISE